MSDTCAPIERRAVMARIIEPDDVRLVLDDGSELVGLESVDLSFDFNRTPTFKARGFLLIDPAAGAPLRRVR